MFTRISNFSYGNYQIANLDDNASGDTAFLIQIQKYEMQCLQLLFGDELYDDFISNLELENSFWKLKSTADEKWGWLLNGHTYPDANDSNVNKKWRGIINKVAKIQNTDVIESMIAPYIYFYYSLNTRTLNIGTGEAKLKAENTTQESTKHKRIDAWNEFVQWASFGYSPTNVSLYQFLQDHKDDFPQPCFLELNTMTYYDI